MPATPATPPNLVQPPTLTQVAVVGAGTMGSGITLCLLGAGLQVQLLEADAASLARGLTRIHQTLQAAVTKGRLTPEAAAGQLARLHPTLDDDGLRVADVVIEAVFEDLDLKRQVFRRLDRICRPGALLASNTSYLDINALAKVTQRPQDVLGLHFFSPAHVMRLLEIVRGTHTGDEALATARALAQRLGKVPVVCGVCDGFIGNRMYARYVEAAHDLIDVGASPAQVDAALEAFGMAMGPFKVGDLAGLDIGRAQRLRRGAPFCAADRLVALGRLGQKTGAGWYRYADGSRTPLPDPEVDALLALHRTTLGLTPGTVSDAEVVQRCTLALVNEGARLLDEGVADSAADIDTVWRLGYGFPASRGGPLRYADAVGLPVVLQTLERLAAAPGAAAWWQAAPLLRRLAAAGTGFHTHSTTKEHA